MEGISLLHKSNLWTPKDLDPSACLVSFSEHKNMFDDDKMPSTRAALTWRLMATVSWSARWIRLISCRVSSGTATLDTMRTFSSASKKVHPKVRNHANGPY